MKRLSLPEEMSLLRGENKLIRSALECIAQRARALPPLDDVHAEWAYGAKIAREILAVTGFHEENPAINEAQLVLETTQRMSPEERTELFERLKDRFCLHCGSANYNRDGVCRKRTCPCSNDE